MIRVYVPCDATNGDVSEAVRRSPGRGAHMIVRECTPRCPLGHRLFDGRWLLAVLALGLLAFLAGCQSLPSLPPGTYPPTGPATPPMNPSPVCSAPTLVRNCYVRPPGEPWSYLCADGLTKVTGPAECGTACVIPDGIEGQGLSRILPAPPGDPAIAEALRTAIRARRTCPDGLSPRCLVGVSLEAWRQEIVAQLGAQGVCAGVQGGADEVCILQSPGRCQGWRVGTCDGSDPIHGCDHGVVVAWPTSGAVRDTWVKGVPPTPGPDPTPDPTPSPDTTCPADTKDATGFRFNGRAKSNPSEWFFWFTAVVKDPDWCKPKFEDPRQWGTCAFFPETHPKRADCERKHGLPVLFGAEQRADNPWSADATVGTPVTACLKSSCSDPSKRETCAVCQFWIVGTLQ